MSYFRFQKGRASLKAQLVKNLPAMQESLIQFLGKKIPWRRNGLPTPVVLGFSCGSTGRESACNVGDLGSICGLGRSSRGGKGYPLQYTGLQNSKTVSPWSFTFIRKLFSFSSLPAIRVVSSAYLRLWIFLPAILIPFVFLPVQHFS